MVSSGGPGTNASLLLRVVFYNENVVQPISNWWKSFSSTVSFNWKSFLSWILNLLKWYSRNLHGNLSLNKSGKTLHWKRRGKKGIIWYKLSLSVRCLTKITHTSQQLPGDNSSSVCRYHCCLGKITVSKAQETQNSLGRSFLQ